MAKTPTQYLFIDESGDPGKPFATDAAGNKIPTGASLFYILAAVHLDSVSLFALENRMMEVKAAYGYRSELKSENIPLALYVDLLKLVNELEIKTFFRLVDKRIYKGKFAIDGNKKLHNVFDEYNLAKVVSFAVKECAPERVEVVIDRADRRLLDGAFDNINDYIKSKVNTKTLLRVEHITHVSSEYVNAMQLSDLICGAIRDHFTGRNKDLKKIIDRKYLHKIW